MKKIGLFFVLLSFSCVLEAGYQTKEDTAKLLKMDVRKRVDLVSYWSELLPSESGSLHYTLLRKKYDVRSHYGLYEYVKNFQWNKPDPTLHKIIFLDYCEDPKIFHMPKKKMICFKWEAIKIPPIWYVPYSIVYTFDDDLVDGKKFFKFYYPVLQPMLKDTPTFEEKKLCTMVATNWIPERRKILEFFETKPIGEFEFYGKISLPYWNSHRMFKGAIPGGVSGNRKLETIKNYRFSICFENTHTTPGYITEKIFDAFAAGIIPIYWGPENVEKYIPKNCFIDYRDFKTDEELYQFLKSISKTTYEQYIANIRQFLKSDQAYLFSPEYFDKLVDEAVGR